MKPPGAEAGAAVGVGAGAGAGAGAAAAAGAATGYRVAAESLCTGDGCGEVLWLDEPLSFWGGTDIATAVVTDVHHPQHGVSLAGRVLVMSASRGSSSSSSVIAEQIRAGVAPAAILLSSRDAIVVLGALAAAEVYGTQLPIVLLEPAALAAVPRAGLITVSVTDAAASVTW